MIKSILSIAIVVAIAATVAYNMGFLSNKGEDAYEKISESVKDAIDR